jgi:hypothetical protein
VRGDILRTEEEIRRALNSVESLDKMLKGRGLKSPKHFRYIARHTLKWVLEPRFWRWLNG